MKLSLSLSLSAPSLFPSLGRKDYIRTHVALAHSQFKRLSLHLPFQRTLGTGQIAWALALQLLGLLLRCKGGWKRLFVLKGVVQSQDTPQNHSCVVVNSLPRSFKLSGSILYTLKCVLHSLLAM